MTILTDADRAEIEATLREIRDDRPAEIIIRRGEITLSAQTVRIARIRNSNFQRGEASKESRGGIVVCGDPDLDIALGDRFTVEGSLYRVLFVRPNRDQGTQAEVELVQ